MLSHLKNKISSNLSRTTINNFNKKTLNADELSLIDNRQTNLFLQAFLTCTTCPFHHYLSQYVEIVLQKTQLNSRLLPFHDGNIYNIRGCSVQVHQLYPKIKVSCFQNCHCFGVSLQGFFLMQVNSIYLYFLCQQIIWYIRKHYNNEKQKFTAFYPKIIHVLIKYGGLFR